MPPCSWLLFLLISLALAYGVFFLVCDAPQLVLWPHFAPNTRTSASLTDSLQISPQDMLQLL